MSKESIYHAEEARVRQQFGQALKQTEKFLVHPSRLYFFRRKGLENLMRGLRIQAVTYGSMANTTSDGNISAQFLQKEANIITTYYDHPRIRKAAQKMKYAKSSEYDMEAEMLRDRGGYHRKAYELTGESKFLEAAIEDFSEAITVSHRETSVHNLAVMELFILRRTLKKPFEIGEFERFRDAFLFVTTNATGGGDRHRAAAWMYLEMAKEMGNGMLYAEGRAKLASALGEDPRITMSAYSNQREQGNATLDARRRSYRRNSQLVDLPLRK